MKERKRWGGGEVWREGGREGGREEEKQRHFSTITFSLRVVT